MKRIDSRETAYTHKAPTPTNASKLVNATAKSDHEVRPILRSRGTSSKRKITSKWKRFARAFR